MSLFPCLMNRLLDAILTECLCIAGSIDSKALDPTVLLVSLVSVIAS